jgi:hypothetical protein
VVIYDTFGDLFGSDATALFSCLDANTPVNMAGGAAANILAVYPTKLKASANLIMRPTTQRIIATMDEVRNVVV